MPKPFAIQSPEAIAKEYAGNKQKIAQAMQMGLVDPTAGVLAGMFIDRMRGAQAQEGAQAPTVAQQVMGGAPPAPGGGGIPPVAAGGAMPQQMGPAPQPPMGAPPAMAAGGLAALPVSDDMFGYADGGLVAFADGGEAVPDELYGFSADPVKQMERFRQLYQPQRKYTDRLNETFEAELDPENQKKRAAEDKWFALAQLGAKMANTPGSLFQSFSAGAAEALPGLRAATKERRAEVRDAVKTLAMQEGANNREALEQAKMALEGTGKYAEFADKLLGRRQEAALTREGYANQQKVAGIQAAATRYSADRSARSYTDYQDKLLRQQIFTAAKEAQDAAIETVANDPRAIKYTPEQREARIQQEFEKNLTRLASAIPGGKGMFAEVLGNVQGGVPGARTNGRVAVQGGKVIDFGKLPPQ